MALADVLRTIVGRLDFAGDDGARDSLMAEIDELDDDDAPAPAEGFSSFSGDDTEADDAVKVDGANA